MKVIEIEKFPEDKSIIGQRVSEIDDFREIHPGTVVTCGGTPTVIYGKIDGDWSVVRSILQSIKFSKNRRMGMYTKKKELLASNGVINTTDITFGFKPSNPVFGNAPSACRLNAEAPGWYEEVANLGEFLLSKYKAFAPEKFEFHKKTVEDSVAPQWRIRGTPYTQGIINSMNALGYHYDRDNFDGVWSCMAYFMNGIKGGNLIIPSLRSKLICADNTYVLFDGCGLMHGVTPITKTRPSGYRYSIVYYSRKSMRGLGTYEEELDRMKNIEVKKHAKRLESK